MFSTGQELRLVVWEGYVSSVQPLYISSESCSLLYILKEGEIIIL